MADRFIKVTDSSGNPVTLRYVDQGDGTWALSGAAVSTVLPPGAATEATLAAQSAKLPASLVNGALATIEMRAQGAAVTAAIANGATVSAVVDLRYYVLWGLSLPAAFTGTSLTFQVSPDNVTFQPAYDATGVAVTLPVAQALNYDLPAAVCTWPYAKVVSNAAEGGIRTLTFIGKA